jgi:hypothetical protein
MSKIKEWREKGYFIDLDWVKTLGRSLPSLLILSIRHPLLVMNANRGSPDGPQNLRPNKLPYVIPKYNNDMKFCDSNERYLRATYLCDPTDPDIIAMANKLGAYKKSDWDYGDSVFKFVNGSIRIDFSSPKTAGECLRWGHGTCIDKLNLFNALCRAGGIKSRYRLYSPQGIEALYNLYMSADPLVQKWVDNLNFFVLHGSGESLIDGNWIISDVSADFYHGPPQRIPIPHFGEDPADLWIKPAKGVWHPEGLPIGFRFLGNLPFLLFKGTGRAINKNIKLNYEEGLRILDNIDLYKYDKEIRKTYKPKWHDSARKASKVLDSLNK